MPIRKIYEVICDQCGDCFTHIYDRSNCTIKQLRKDGVIITNKGEVFCCRECYKERGGEE